MFSRVIDGTISVNQAMRDAGAEVMRIIGDGSVEILVHQYDEKTASKRRSTQQNRLIYKIYQRIGKALYGGDESHARNECKLRIGCRILFRDSKEFATRFDRIIRPLTQEMRLDAMNLISVSSLFDIPQGTEYIKTMLTEYSARGVYFLDLDGADDYLKFPEAQ